MFDYVIKPESFPVCLDLTVSARARSILSNRMVRGTKNSN